MIKKYQQLKTLSKEEMKEVAGGQLPPPLYKYNCTGSTAPGVHWTECIYDAEHPNNCPGAVCVPDGSCSVYTGYACD